MPARLPTAALPARLLCFLITAEVFFLVTRPLLSLPGECPQGVIYREKALARPGEHPFQGRAYLCFSELPTALDCLPPASRLLLDCFPTAFYCFLRREVLFLFGHYGPPLVMPGECPQEDDLPVECIGMARRARPFQGSLPVCG